MVILLFVSHTGEQPKWFDNMVKSIPTQLWLLSTTAFWSICLAFEILVIQYHITQDWHYWGNRRGSFWCFGSCSDYEWLGLVALRTKILDLMSKFKVKYNCWIRSRPLGGYSGQCHNQFYFEQIHIRFLSPAVSSNCKSLQKWHCSMYVFVIIMLWRHGSSWSWSNKAAGEEEIELYLIIWL